MDILRSDEDAKPIAGGQSLIPMMKLRLAMPSMLVDLSKLNELKGVKSSKESIKIGAMERIAEIAANKELSEKLPALSEAASSIADTQVRDMGTIGGNVSNADPSNDMPVVVLGYGAKLHIASKDGMRIEDPESFFLGPYTTKLGSSDILTDIEFEIPNSSHCSAYSRLNRRVGDYALAACCVYMEMDSTGRCTKARIAVSGFSDKATRITDSENSIIGKKPSKQLFSDAAKLAYDSISAESSYYASEKIKRLAISYVIEDALTKAYSSIIGE